MKNSYSKIGTLILLVGVTFFLGCETGTSNKAPVDTSGKIDSGIVSQNANYKPHTPKEGEMNKIFTTSGTPGYYIQVGYFSTQNPNSDIINRLKYASLPYVVIKKSSKNYLLVGAYASYNKAREMKGIARERVTEGAFIVKVVRP
ncbi:MAG: SPOR domain-containing protein [Sulfurovaceae bacterium]|nr:SPOR domain-containing protein [Sulfurovaceae bacterium]